MYFTEASDHLPLFVDIEVDFKYLINEKLKDVEKNDDFIKNRYIKIDADDFICIWNKINETSYTKDNFRVYNGQPSKTYKWINHLSKIQKFQDPYNFGNSPGSNSLGNNGLYGASTLDKGITWAKSFVSKGIREKSLTSHEKNILIHELKINFDENIKICYIGNDLEWLNYRDDF